MDVTPLASAIIIPLLATLSIAVIAWAAARFLLVRRAVVVLLFSLAPVVVVIELADFGLHFAAEGFAAFGQRDSFGSSVFIPLFVSVISIPRFPEIWRKLGA